MKKLSDFDHFPADHCTVRGMPRIKLIQSAEHSIWDRYVSGHPASNVYHLSGWRSAIERAYGYPTHYLMAVSFDGRDPTDQTVQGVLPLIHMRSLIFGNHLISMPFFDSAGVLCSSPEVGRLLIREALQLGKKLGAKSIEIRQCNRLDNPLSKGVDHGRADVTDKVRLLLDLPSSSARLMSSFKSKVRSQIKNPINKGLQTRVGGIELLNDFYAVFSENMRDLGSPVHSMRLIEAVMQEFANSARIFLIHQDEQPLATSLVIGFNGMLCNPWASSLRRFRSLNANMLLYWRMLEYGCDNGFRFFDFGRSAPDEGTYKFKQQWGAHPVPLVWYTIPVTMKNAKNASPDKKSYGIFIRMWRRMPLPLTRIIGPPIRKRINL